MVVIAKEKCRVGREAILEQEWSYRDSEQRIEEGEQGSQAEDIDNK